MNSVAGAGNYILEKASIDELYLDVTSYCDVSSAGDETPPDVPEDTKYVVIGGKGEGEGGGNKNLPKRLGWAAYVVEKVRKDVKEKVGFTMSAGVSKNKTMAKLSASHCKPDGLAVLPPSSVDVMLRTTKMIKVRNFGGKLGKKVIEAVVNERGGGDTGEDDIFMRDVGAISVDNLRHRHGFGNDTAMWLFRLMNRGDEDEEVEMTKVRGSEGWS